MFTPRFYQQDAFEKAKEYINSNSKETNIIVAPVGSGKSLVIALIADYVKDKDILVLQPSKELLEQNYEKYVSFGGEASIYSASMGVKELGRVTFATIKSIEKEKISPFLVIIDEAHLQSKNGSVLSTFITRVGAEKVIGLTATPVELRSDGFYGSHLVMMNRSKKNFFNKILHVTNVKTVVEAGFWAKLIYNSKTADTSMLKENSTGNDYTDISLRKYYEANSLEKRVLDEVSQLRQNGRKSILIFVPSISEAEILQKKIKGSYSVHSKTNKKERDIVVKAFKKQDIDVVITVEALLTGFDHPLLDTIINCRPTASFAMHYQMLGRGVRPHKDKESCLIIDYSGNVLKFGKLEDVEFKEEEGRWGLFSVNNQITTGVVYKAKKTFDGKIWFGKHAGKMVTEIPIGYCNWLLENFEPKKENELELIKIIKDRIGATQKETVH